MFSHYGIAGGYNNYLGGVHVCNSYYPRSGATWVMLHKSWMLSRGRSPSETSARGQLTHVVPFLG